MKPISIVGISGKVGQYMTEHALACGYEITGVCRPQSLGKLARFEGRISDRAPSANGRSGEAATRRMKLRLRSALGRLRTREFQTECSIMTLSRLSVPRAIPRFGTGNRRGHGAPRTSSRLE